MIRINASERPTIKEILDNPFFTDVRDLSDFPAETTTFQMKKLEIIEDLISWYSVHQLKSWDEFTSELESKIDELMP